MVKSKEIFLFWA